MTAALRLLIAALGVVLVAGCTNGHPKHSTAPSTPPSSDGPQYYVSLGDSYAAGYQPTGRSGGKTTRNGFAYQVVTDAAKIGYHLTLENFGCSGATTSSLLHTVGCEDGNLAPGAEQYAPKTQAQAAEDFIRAHRAQVALITVVIGGNDVIKCGSSPDPLTCVPSAMTTVKANLATELANLRDAAGPNVRIVGLTYPDVLLAGEVSSIPQAKSLAPLSVAVFQDVINPALKSAYDAIGATFVDVTAQTGAYGPLTATTTLAPYGTIPVPVATVCKLTYACQYTDIHPRTEGYALIAGLVTAQLPPR